MARADKPFAPKGEYAPGAEIIWETESGWIRTGQIWAEAPKERGHSTYWVVPHEPYSGEYAARVLKVRKSGNYCRNRYLSSARYYGEGEAVGLSSWYEDAAPAAEGWAA